MPPRAQRKALNGSREELFSRKRKALSCKEREGDAKGAKKIIEHTPSLV
jgi:hypothetical protein